MAHKGIRQYGGEEGGNIALGQLGFKVLTGTSGTAVEGDFVAIKLIGGADAADTGTIAATCHQGDDLAATAILTGEIIWGAYSSVTFSARSDAAVDVLLYHG
jgi:hypothetical protein|tara:strand:+ start:2705 stop:3010 length:306 start_codon:yes stop_codon:yes gene_type:complete